MHPVLAATSAIVMTLCGSVAAAAGPGPLEGRYGLSGIGTCLTSPNGFHPNQVAIEPSASNSTVNQGVLTFERDGTGSATIAQTQLGLPPAPATYSSAADVSFRFTHELGPDGALTVTMLLDTYEARYRSGPNAGLRAAFVTTPPLSPVWTWSGTATPDRKTLLLNNGNTVSRLQFSSGVQVYVVCQFARVLTRLTP